MDISVGHIQPTLCSIRTPCNGYGYIAGAGVGATADTQGFTHAIA